MTAAITNLKTRLANWRQWELNPIVVKELRQAVRSWAVTGMLLLFLAVLFCTSLGFLVTFSFQANENQQLGGNMFQTFTVILAGASILFIPLYAGVRMAAERQESNLDLLYTSTLTPGGIIRGKFLSGAYTALLFFSACMPFMVFTNLLRGVDLPTIFLILVYLFVVVCVAVMVAIVLACLPASRGFKILLGLSCVIGAQFVVFPLVFFSWQMMRSGVGAMMGAPQFWYVFFTAAGMVLAGFGLLYFLSVALISPVSANRALPLRLYLTIVWLLGGGLSLFWVFHQSEPGLILPWSYATFSLMVPALIVLVSSNDQLSLRVRRDIPQPGIKRVLAFLLFNGAAGGLAWTVLLLTATLAATQGVMAWHSGHGASVWFGPKGWSAANDILITSYAVLAYTLAYTLTGLFIHRKFLGKRPPKVAGLLVVSIAAAMALTPYVTLFFVNRLSWDSMQELQLGNVFNISLVRDGSGQWEHLAFALCWMTLAVLFNVRWFVAQVKSFRPLERTARPPVPPVPQSLNQA